MEYQEEKIRRLVKIGLSIVGILIVFGLFVIIVKSNGSTLSSGSYSVNNKMGTGMDSVSYGSGVRMMNPLSSSSQISEGPTGKMIDPEMASGEMMVEASVVEDANYEIDKKIIKNGNLSLKVGSTDWATEQISNIAKEKGGDVFSTNVYETIKGQKSGYVTIKVPVDKFGEAIDGIKKIATQVVNESTNAQDVTEQYTDLQAQLKNKKAEEESFVKILGTAGKIDDVLAATREVARVRGEIERLEGKIRFMDNQTDMSTITINLTEDVTVTPVSEGWRPWQVAKQSFKELIDNIQGFADGLIRFIIVGIPSLIPFALLVIFLVWIGRKVHRKMIS